MNQNKIEANKEQRPTDVVLSDLLGDSEKIIMHLTENHVGFDDTTLHIARQWMRALWGVAMQQAGQDTFRLDWMENNYRGVETYPMDDPDGEPTRRLWIPELMDASMARPTIREAIDAALSPNTKLTNDHR
jgi:hypothetical protein